MARGNTMNSLIGSGSTFEGRFFISGSLRIDGKFEGEIRTEDELILGETGRIKTNVTARKVIVAGTIIGNIKAQNEVRLEGTGKIYGDIHTPMLHINPGALVEGMIIVTGGQDREIKKIVEESYGGKAVEK